MESERAVAALESWSSRIFLVSFGPFWLSGLLSDLIDGGLAYFRLSFAPGL